MPYASHFYPEHHLLYERVEGIAIVQDALDIYQGNLRMLDQVETPIHIILDLRLMERFPTSLRDMKEVLTPIENPKLWWMIIVVDANPILKFIISTTVQIVSKTTRFKLVASLEEARIFLLNIDPSLDFAALEVELQHLT